MNSFRLIVVAEKQDVYKKFPIPLINRLEKHFLATTNMLTDVQIHIAKELDQWAKDFATLHRTQRRAKEKYVWFLMYELDASVKCKILTVNLPDSRKNSLKISKSQ